MTNLIFSFYLLFHPLHISVTEIEYNARFKQSL